MTRDELLKSLGLSDKLPTPKAAKAAGVGSASAVPDESLLSDTALRLDDWDLRMGDELADQWALEVGRHEGKGLAAADCFAAAFEPDVELSDGCVDRTRFEFFKALLDTAAYKAMHEHTMLNEITSTMAALDYMDQLDKLKAEEPEKGHGRVVQVLRHAAEACEHAKDEVQALEDAARACGLGPGDPGSNDPGRIAALYKKIRHNDKIRKICELAGRCRRYAQACQRQKTIHGYDDMVGVTLDGDLGRLLPHELAKVDDEDFGLDFLRRLVERQTMCREYAAVEPMAQGPIIMIVDESGSMHGDRGDMAKAIALTMAWIARQQKRWIALVAFAGDKEGRRLELHPGAWDEMALVEWLEQWLGGGTELDVPLVQVPEWYPNTDGKTDLICVTDAIVNAPARIIDTFNAWKAATKCRMITIVVGETQAGDLAKVSDELHFTAVLGLDCEGVQNALSI